MLRDHHTSCVSVAPSTKNEFVETPTKSKLKQPNFPDISGTGQTTSFWLVRDGRSVAYLSGRPVATVGSTRARQFLSHDDHCSQFEGLLLLKHLSQRRNEQVGSAILFELRESWPSHSCSTQYVTLAWQSTKELQANPVKYPDNNAHLLELTCAQNLRADGGISPTFPTQCSMQQSLLGAQASISRARGETTYGKACSTQVDFARETVHEVCGCVLMFRKEAREIFSNKFTATLKAFFTWNRLRTSSVYVVLQWRAR